MKLENNKEEKPKKKLAIIVFIYAVALPIVLMIGFILSGSR
jgi:hypothetical protein